MIKFSMVYRKMTNAWRVTVGAPFLVISLLLTLIYMRTLGHVYPEFIIVIIIAWWGGFFARGVTDALVDALAEFAEDVGIVDD